MDNLTDERQCSSGASLGWLRLDRVLSHAPVGAPATCFAAEIGAYIENLRKRAK